MGEETDPLVIDNPRSRKQHRKLKAALGRTSLPLGLFSNDLRSAPTNGAIIQTIALNGPMYLASITHETPKTAATWGISIAETPAAYHQRINDLYQRGFLFKAPRKTAHPGVPSSVYDLTYRGAFLAVTMPGVRKRLSDFMKWERQSNREHDHGRLPGLYIVGLFMDQGIAPEYWEYFITEVAKKVLGLCDLMETSEDELYEIWYTALTGKLAELQQERRSDKLAHLRQLGWTEAARTKFRAALRNDPDFKARLTKINQDAQTAAQLYSQAMKDMQLDM